MGKPVQVPLWAACALACLTLSCSDTGKSGSSSGPEQFSVLLTRTQALQTAVNADAIFIDVAQIDAVYADGTKVTVSDTPTTYDLLQLDSGSATLAGVSGLPEGTLTQLVLVLTDSTIVVDGTSHPLSVPSNSIKIGIDSVVITKDCSLDIVLDFDADKSVKGTGRDKDTYRLTPVIHTALSTDCPAPPDPGTDTGTDPGTDAGTDPGTDTGGTDPGTDAGGTDPGTDAGGTDPGTDAGGTDPGTDAGGTDPGADAGGTTPPAPFPTFGYVGYEWDAASFAGVVADGGVITTDWVDTQQGYGLSPGGDPTFMASGGNGGRPTVYLDGELDKFQANVKVLSQPFTVIIEFYLDANYWVYNYNSTFYDGTQDGQRASSLVLAPENLLTMYSGNVQMTATAPPTDTWAVLSAVHDTTQSDLYLDGTPLLTNVDVGAQDFSTLKIGANTWDMPTTFFKGRIAWIGMWEGALTQAEVDQVRAYRGF